jgi:hypothetical protein
MAVTQEPLVFACFDARLNKSLSRAGKARFGL